MIIDTTILDSICRNIKKNKYAYTVSWKFIEMGYEEYCIFTIQSPPEYQEYIKNIIESNMPIEDFLIQFI